ncbi:MAG: NIPSNAP family protein [Candidatus Pristimantibacillus lignocellulolyticus]|uniref:NIPSNAP family protein n=1 Tax=Candidatus Pristimantibacillus lignocellulolyticus TaxID=2994561 RepID=A0A9J6ZD08_9BACL|nr:MAG: NIPSNAP family protein [Candidatus Pristimantibacillus lignocellulolyticus]
MIYRRKTYFVDTSFVEEFNSLFNDILLPAQLKNGSRLIGRWCMSVDDDISEIFAMWEYDSLEQYEEIEKKIKSDEDHVKLVQLRFDQIGRDRMKEVLRKNIEQKFLTLTVDREKTILNKIM